MYHHLFGVSTAIITFFDYFFMSAGNWRKHYVFLDKKKAALPCISMKGAALYHYGFN